MCPVSDDDGNFMGIQQVAQRAMKRAMLDVSLFAKIRNTEIRRRTDETQGRKLSSRRDLFFLHF